MCAKLRFVRFEKIKFVEKHTAKILKLNTQNPELPEFIAKQLLGIQMIPTSKIQTFCADFGRHLKT